MRVDSWWVQCHKTNSVSMTMRTLRIQILLLKLGWSNLKVTSNVNDMTMTTMTTMTTTQTLSSPQVKTVIEVWRQCTDVSSGSQCYWPWPDHRDTCPQCSATLGAPFPPTLAASNLARWIVRDIGRCIGRFTTGCQGHHNFAIDHLSVLRCARCAPTIATIGLSFASAPAFASASGLWLGLGLRLCTAFGFGLGLRLGWGRCSSWNNWLRPGGGRLRLGLLCSRPLQGTRCLLCSWLLQAAHDIGVVFSLFSLRQGRPERIHEVILLLRRVEHRLLLVIRARGHYDDQDDGSWAKSSVNVNRQWQALRMSCQSVMFKRWTLQLNQKFSQTNQIIDKWLRREWRPTNPKSASGPRPQWHWLSSIEIDLEKGKVFSN